MSFEMIESVFTINVDMTMTTAMAAVLLVLGYTSSCCWWIYVYAYYLDWPYDRFFCF